MTMTERRVLASTQVKTGLTMAPQRIYWWRLLPGSCTRRKTVCTQL